MERRPCDLVLHYMGGLGARAAAAAGDPRARHHLGRLVLAALRDAPDDFVLQIDGGTGASETGAAALARSVRCAGAMQAAGLRAGDAVALLAANRLDLAAAFYAALYLGLPVAPLDRTLTVPELTASLGIVRPRLVVCEAARAGDVQRALNALEPPQPLLLAFDARAGDLLPSFPAFLRRCPPHLTPDSFQAADIDPAEAVAVLLPTSGTTGAPKLAAITHQSLAITAPYLWSRHTEFPAPTRLFLVVSPLQWLTAVLAFLLAPLLRYSRLQTSAPVDPDHVRHLVRTYKPSFTLLSPALAAALAAGGGGELACFDTVLLGGSAVSLDLIQRLKEIAPRTEVLNVYGMTELTSLAFHPSPRRPASCGTPLGCFHYRLVDVETEEDITEPNKEGELWVKGPGLFKGYQGDPAASAAVLAPGGWLRTGDLFYRDDDYHYYFVERIKLLLKYKSHHVSPAEVEAVVARLAGVAAVAVAGRAHADGDLPVACVVRRPGDQLSAQDVKDIVRENLSDAKQLRGGVVFLQQLPMTASGKVHRRRLRDLLQTLDPARFQLADL